MESKANYAFVGLFVLAALAAVLSFILWFSSTEFDQQYDEYDVVFEGAVRGLSQGSEVRFNGLPVGEVIGLGLDINSSNSVIAKIQVQAETPIHIDSTAQLEPQGLTGLNYIQISAGSDLVNGDVKSALAKAETSMAEIDQTLIEFRKVALNSDKAVTDVRDAVNF